MENDDQATFVFMKPNADIKELQNERDSVREILQQALIEHRKLLNQVGYFILTENGHLLG